MTIYIRQKIVPQPPKLYYSVQMEHTIIPQTPKFHDSTHEADNCPYSERHYSNSLLYIPVIFRLIVMLFYFLRLDFTSLTVPSDPLTNILCPCPTAACSPYTLFFSKYSSLYHFANNTTYYISHYLFFHFFFIPLPYVSQHPILCCSLHTKEQAYCLVMHYKIRLSIFKQFQHVTLSEP